MEDNKVEIDNIFKELKFEVKTAELTEAEIDNSNNIDLNLISGGNNNEQSAE